MNPQPQRKTDTSPAKIYLARHCKTAWNLEGRLQGTVDLPLAEVGIEEAKTNVGVLPTSFCEVGSWGPPMTRQLISTNRQLLLRHVTRSVRRAAGFVQVPLWEITVGLTISAICVFGADMRPKTSVYGQTK